MATIPLALMLAGCPGGVPGLSSAPDAGPESTGFFVDTGAGDKSLVYNLVGRWYPEEEIKRLSDRTLTPEQWCEREPGTVFIMPDRVEVRCNRGTLHAAAIAEIKRDKAGLITLGMRAPEGSPLRALTFDARGPNATIAGNPCLEGPIAYGRFPEYEILTRQILGGRRCAQVLPQP